MQVLYQVFGGHKPEVPDDMPADYRALMEDCWATAPAARPTFPAILERLQPMLADARTAIGRAVGRERHTPLDGCPATRAAGLIRARTAERPTMDAW